jgi:hypothetical protein
MSLDNITQEKYGMDIREVYSVKNLYKSVTD